MINQICIAGLVQGLSEAMAFGKKSNVDMEKVLSVNPREQLNHGRWKIDIELCLMESLIMVLL